MTKREAPIYKVIFLNQGQVFEMYAKQIYQSDLWGFLEVEEFVFGERTQVVVDPSEEKLKAQFEGVVRSFVPMHSIVRIDEVERRRRVRGQVHAGVQSESRVRGSGRSRSGASSFGVPMCMKPTMHSSSARPSRRRIAAS